VALSIFFGLVNGKYLLVEIDEERKPELTLVKNPVLSTKKSSSRIFHGKNTNEGERKYQLMLSVLDANGQPTKRGGAILIKENFALTAAQLVTDEKLAPVKHIRLRYVSIRIDMIEMKPCQPCDKKLGCVCRDMDERGILTIHGNFAHRNPPYEGAGYDIALIKFPANKRFNQRKNVEIIAFSSKTPQQLIGTQFFASGWGQTESSGGRYADALKVVQMEFVDPDTVSGPNRGFYPLRIVPSVLAASQVDMKSTCTADIGGPATIINSKKQEKLVGIISYQVGGCGNPDGLNLFESVSFHDEWIKEAMKVMEQGEKACKAPAFEEFCKTAYIPNKNIHPKKNT